MRDLTNTRGVASFEDITNPIFAFSSKEECKAMAWYLEYLETITLISVHSVDLTILANGTVKFDWLNVIRKEIKRGLTGPTPEQLQKFLTCINQRFSRDYKNTDWALEDTCDFIESALDAVGYKVPDFVYDLDEYPKWYLAIERVAVDSAKAYQILVKP